MGLVTRICRCIPGFSIILWVVIAYLALGDRIPGWFASPNPNESAKNVKNTYGDLHHLTVSQGIYIVYSVLVHVLACFAFPLRLIWSVWHMTDEIKTAKFEAAEEYAETEFSDDKSSQHSLSVKSLSGTESSISRVGTPKIPSLSESPEPVVHAIILPSYKEDIDTLRETLSVLASHVLAKSNYDVYLAMEQRDPDAESTATQLILVFATSFRNISFTLHPGDISGEVAGKSSNVSWAARQLSHNYVDSDSRKNCVITVLDADTHLSSNYFLLITKFHRENPTEAATTLYCTPIIFDRNSNDVNPFVRVADIFWCGAGISGLYKGSPIMIPTSVYSIAMTLAGEVGGWDTGPESIGEDLHMYLKCYFSSSGQFHTRIIYSPASQSNVSSDLKGVSGAINNLQARYKQAMRHMWGSLDTGYAVERALQILWKKNDEKLSSWLSRASDPADRVPRWVNDSNLTHFTPPNIYEDINQPRTSFSKINLIILFHRLFEAHFLPSHLTIALVSAVLYSTLVPPILTHRWLLWSFGFNATMRLIGFCLFSFYLFLYESYHQLCVRTREDEMKRAGLWDRMQGGFTHRTWKRNFIDYCLMPVTGTMFGTIPAVMAEISHFWTDQLVYTVSAKPQLNREIEKVVEMA
ncbi:hypothetical protein MMC18_002548 [Xylographa bjoerkii]|nr:hypothetical protein [Xylographa bjoerkii]